MKRVQALRERANLSRRQLAQLANLDAPSYGKAESGRLLSPSQLVRVAKVLGWTGDPSALLEEVEEG